MDGQPLEFSWRPRIATAGPFTEAKTLVLSTLPRKTLSRSGPSCGMLQEFPPTHVKLEAATPNDRG